MSAQQLDFTSIETIVDERRRGNRTEYRVRWVEDSVTAEDLDKYGGKLRSKYDKLDSTKAIMYIRGYDEDLDEWINHPCGDASQWKIVAVLGMEFKNGLPLYKVRWADNWVTGVNDLALQGWREIKKKNKKKQK